MPAIIYESAVSELYAAPREAFVARRTELVNAARAAGDRALATRIGKLAKPTTAAWLANRLARTDPDGVRDLVELGAALRSAHDRLDGAEIRSLIQRRSELIGDLLSRVEGDEDEALGDAVNRDLTEILTAATADEGLASALVAGTLSSAKAFESLPEWPSVGTSAPKPTARSKPAPRPRTTAGKATKTERDARQRADRMKRRELAEQALKAARADVKKAEADRAATERLRASTESEAAAATEAVERLESKLKAAETHEKEAQVAVTNARRAVREATDRAARAWRRVQAAEAKLNG